MPWKTVHNIRAIYTRKTKTRTHKAHELIFGGKFFACLALNWQATGSFFVFLCFFWRAVVIEMLCGHWTNCLFWTIHIKHTHKESIVFLIILRQMRVFVIREDSPLFIKKVFKILPLRQVTTWHCNFETRAILDCRCYEQYSQENESRTEIRREPFIRAAFVLDKTYLYKWYSSRLMQDASCFSSYKWPY